MRTDHQKMPAIIKGIDGHFFTMNTSFSKNPLLAENFFASIVVAENETFHVPLKPSPF